MSRVLAAPSAGQPVSASFCAEMLREIRANRPLPGVNTRTIRTPNGTHIIALGAAGHASKAKKLPGRFEIVGIVAQRDSEGRTRYLVKMRNPYYDVGGRTYEMNPPPPQEEDEEQEDEDIVTAETQDGGIIVLRISAGAERTENLDSVLGVEELREMQGDFAWYTIPLYMIRGGSVACDFRTGPVAAMGEFES